MFERITDVASRGLDIPEAALRRGALEQRRSNHRGVSKSSEALARNREASAGIIARFDESFLTCGPAPCTTPVSSPNAL